MSDSDLEELEKSAADLDAEHGPDFSDEEKSRLGALNDQLGKGYNQEKPKGRLRGAASNLSTYKKLGITAGILGIGVAIVIAIFSFLLPFKLTHIVDSIEQRVGNVPGYAVENRLEFYMSRYLMIRALEETGQFDFAEGGADRERFTYLGDGFWKTMYTNWKGAKIEEKMVTQHGVKLRATANPELIRSGKLRAAHFELEQIDPSCQRQSNFS